MLCVGKATDQRRRYDEKGGGFRGEMRFDKSIRNVWMMGSRIMWREELNGEPGSNEIRRR